MCTETTPTQKKSAFVAIVGRPSAGKSTLLNAILGEMVSLVSPVPQTTRNAIRGIFTDERGQLVFIDTPGLHNAQKKMNKKLLNVVRGSLGDADVVLYLVDSSREFGAEEQAILDLMKTLNTPLVVAFSKTDLDKNGSLRQKLAEEIVAPLADKMGGRAPLQVAAKLSTRENRLPDLDSLLETLFSLAVEGPEWYPSEFYTDQDPEFRIAEIVRGAVIQCTHDEIPHACYINVEELTLSSPDGSQLEPNSDPGAYWDVPLDKRPLLTIRANIELERETQKGIVIGAGGKKLGEIRKIAEKQLFEIFPWRMRLELNVDVRPDWRSNDDILGRLIH